MRVNADPAFTVPVSSTEKKLAAALRKKFEDLLEELEEFDRFLLVFFDNIDDLEETANLKSLSPLIKKYERRLKKRFNEFMDKLELALDVYQTGFADTKLDNIRDLIIENTKSMRKGLIELLKLFKNVENPEFIAESKSKYVSISNSIRQMNIIVKDELFGHIDYDILGRIRLGLHEAPLVLRGKYEF